MPTISKRLLLSLLATSLLVPSLTFAQNGQDDNAAEITPSPSATPKVERIESAEFCAKAADIIKNVGDDTAGRFDKLNNDFTQRGSKISANFSDIDRKLAEKHAQSDTSRDQRFASLLEKAQTNAQKQAILTFQTEVNTAVANHRAALAAANTAYKQGVIAAVTQRQTQFKAAAATYRTAVTTALNRAKASCAAGTSPKVVRDRLRVALNAAKQNLEASRKSIESGRTNLEPLKAARKAAIDKANANFKTALKLALVKLKAALGADQASSSPKPSKSPEASTTPSPSATPQP